jgi:hypothetical protein
VDLAGARKWCRKNRCPCLPDHLRRQRWSPRRRLRSGTARGVPVRCHRGRALSARFTDAVRQAGAIRARWMGRRGRCSRGTGTF